MFAVLPSRSGCVGCVTHGLREVLDIHPTTICMGLALVRPGTAQCVGGQSTLVPHGGSGEQNKYQRSVTVGVFHMVPTQKHF